jgi:diguanylate cyclase (GGDEF)-like protein
MGNRLSCEDSTYWVLFRAAIYAFVFASILSGLYVYSYSPSFDQDIRNYLLSVDSYGQRFRAFMLPATLFLASLGYLISQKAKLFRKALLAEKELRHRTVEIERINKLLSREIDERKKAEDLLTRHAFYDPLTGLPNRLLFIDRLRSSLERQKRYPDHAFAVLFIDLDRFKVVNDSLGHMIGDQLLIMLAQRLKKHIRGMDTVARFGGDEFAILMEDTKGTAEVNEIAGRFHNEMTSPFPIMGHEIFTTMSIGIVMSSGGDYTRSYELLRDADTAMYHAKERGKACHVIFDSTMRDRAHAALWMETELRKAVEQKDFIVYYQPIMSIGEDRITGFEALLRWRHAERGLITPSDFIVIAEETGLILSLGELVIHEACRQLKAWQSRFPHCRDLTVSVNVSAKVFSRPNFYEFVRKVLEDTGLEGRCLRLEVVESVLIENPEPAAALMRRFRELDVRFDIDDFGTGYSALNYLRHFPIGGLKIDSSFINALTLDKNNAAIVRTVIALGKDLGLDVVAEGIETVEQLDVFRTIEGQFAQGFYLCRPMDSKAAGDLLSSREAAHPGGQG